MMKNKFTSHIVNPDSKSFNLNDRSMNKKKTNGLVGAQGGIP